MPQTQISYQEFVKEVFDHPVTEPAWHWNEDTVLDHLDPDSFVEHSTRMFREFGVVGPSFSMGQINQGLWLLFSCSLGPSLTTCLVDLYERDTKDINLTDRIECIKSIFYVYADFVAKPQTEVLETCFDMWWDVICTDFWSCCESSRKLSDADSKLIYSGLYENEKLILDTIFDTLLRILDLDDDCCKQFALHGIGHSRHPKRASTVQAFIDSNIWAGDGLPWLERCRDGTVM